MQMSKPIVMVQLHSCVMYTYLYWIPQYLLLNILDPKNKILSPNFKTKFHGPLKYNGIWQPGNTYLKRKTTPYCLPLRF